MRRLVVALVAIVALLVVADRVAVLAADHVVAGRIQADQQLDSRPSVSIHGFPFLTQALGGKYDDVTLTLHDLRKGGVPIRTLRVRLRGVHVPLGAVVSQHLRSVPIDRAEATVVVTVGQGLDFSIPLGALPFRIALTGAKATKQGIAVTATASGLVVHPT